jgi:sulfur carrier protein ThiS
MSDFITVKVIRVPGGVNEVAVNEGATVAEVLAAADISPNSNEAIKIGAEAVDLDSTVSDGDRVVIAQGAKGN